MHDLLIDQNLEVTQYDLEVSHDNPVDQEVKETLDVNVDYGDALLRRSQRIRKPAIFSDYIVYLQEHEFDVGDILDPFTY